MGEVIVDDDFCDSVDGTDEPHTSACSFFTTDSRFDCGDGRKIFLSRVHDGVKDCANGSDEIVLPKHSNELLNIPRRFGNHKSDSIGVKTSLRTGISNIQIKGEPISLPFTETVILTALSLVILLMVIYFTQCGRRFFNALCSLKGSVRSK